MQPFKENDTTEPKVRDSFLSTLNGLGTERNSFYADAYEAYPLGDVLYSLGRDPMVDIISQEVYRTSYFAIHQLFTEPGTFEFYLTVFRTVFGASVAVTFTIPAPGKLLITAQVLNYQTYKILTRRIVNDVYIYEPLVKRNGEHILGTEKVGIKTQREVNSLVFELAPAGVWTQCTLVLT